MLPSTKTTVETLINKESARPWVDNFIERNNELEAIFEILQPLLYKLSVTIYESGEDVSLHKLVTDAIAYLDKEKDNE